MPITRRADALRPRKQPRQGRSRDTVEVILRAAAQVFSTRGYAATTTNHIAERAGVSIGSLYEYFPNKDALLVALLEEHIEEAEKILSEVWSTLDPSQDVSTLVRAFVRAMVEVHARDRALHRLLTEEAPLPRRTRQRLFAIERDTASRVEAYLRAQPQRIKRDPALAAAIVVQCIESITHKIVVHGDKDVGIDAYVEEIVALVTSYLAAP